MSIKFVTNPEEFQHLPIEERDRVALFLYNCEMHFRFWYRVKLLILLALFVVGAPIAYFGVIRPVLMGVQHESR